MCRAIHQCNRVLKHNITLIEDYIEILYMIDKRYISSIQCRRSLRGHKSMRKVVGLSLIFIDFYVPALTPRLNSTETSLQLSENITVFTICRIYTGET
jgi:hypothetical protein